MTSRVNELANAGAPNLRVLLKMVLLKLVIKYVERRKAQGITVITGCGMRK